MHRDELIARLEDATGPDRELDAAIAAFVTGGTVCQEGRFWKPGVRGFCIAPQYSASIDAALTLVPEGSGYELTGYTADEQAECILWDIDLARDTCAAVAATPALAICIAALRARHD